MKNTAIGNHAGPVGSITTSRRVPPDVPASAAFSISVRLATVGSALRFASVVPCPSRTRTACADAIPKSMPTRRLSFMPSPSVVPSSTGLPEKQRRFVGHGPKDTAPTAAPTHVLQPGPTSNGADPLPSCGASVAGTSTTIRLTRPDPRASLSAVLNATTRTSRDDNATPGPRPRGGSPVPVLLTCAGGSRRRLGRARLPGLVGDDDVAFRSTDFVQAENGGICFNTLLFHHIHRVPDRREYLVRTADVRHRLDKIRREVPHSLRVRCEFWSSLREAVVRIK